MPLYQYLFTVLLPTVYQNQKAYRLIEHLLTSALTLIDIVAAQKNRNTKLEWLIAPVQAQTLHAPIFLLLVCYPHLSAAEMVATPAQTQRR